MPKANTKTVQFVLGDHSGDGHGKTETFSVISNLTEAEIEKAYEAGTTIIGFDFSLTVAAEYEESFILKDNLETLRQHGCTVELFDEQFADSEEYVLLQEEEFLAIYLFIVKLGNKDFKYKIVEFPTNIKIGGYGLFGS